MRMLPVLTAAAAVALVGLCASTQAATITRGFDDIANGTTYADQYPEFSITTDTPTATVEVFLASFGGNHYADTPPNAMGAMTSGGTIGNLRIDYHDATPVSFAWLGNETMGSVGDVQVYSGSTLEATLHLISPASMTDSQNPKYIDLTSYSNVTRVDITNITDQGGLAFDSFVVSPVPEPAALSVAAFASCGLLGRRRHKRA